MKSLLLCLLLAVSLPALAKISIDKCASKKVHQFRISPEAKRYEVENGFEPAITQDMLDEWRADCYYELEKRRKIKPAPAK